MAGFLVRVIPENSPGLPQDASPWVWLKLLDGQHTLEERDTMLATIGLQAEPREPQNSDAARETEEAFSRVLNDLPKGVCITYFYGRGDD